MGCGTSTELGPFDTSLYSAPTEWDDCFEGKFAAPSRGVPAGRQLHYRRWTPKGRNPVGYIFAIHGLHEHGGRFTEFAHLLTKEGFIVFAADYYGHGQSGGTPGVLSDPAWLYADQVEFIDAMLQEAEPQLPVFLHAHSLGSLIVLHVAHILTTRTEKLVPVRALGITGSALDPGPGAASPFGLECLFFITRLGACTRAIACCLGAVAPQAPNAPIWEHALMSDADQLALYRKDPWIYRREIMNVTAYTVLQLSASARELVPQLNVPAFVMHGAQDRITFPSGSQYIYDNAATDPGEKKLQIVDGAQHEIFHEDVETRTQAMNAMKEWYLAHL